MLFEINNPIIISEFPVVNIACMVNPQFDNNKDNMFIDSGCGCRVWCDAKDCIDCKDDRTTCKACSEDTWQYSYHCYDKTRVDTSQFSNIGHLKPGVDGNTKTNLLIRSEQYDSLCTASNFDDVRKCTECKSGSAYLINFSNGFNRCHPLTHIPFGFGK